METLYRDPAFQPDEKALKQLPDLSCSAGENLVAIGADGAVYPCLQLLSPIGNLVKQRFSDVWSRRNNAFAAIRAAAFGHLSECTNCADAMLCQRCPGLALLEEGSISAPSRIACTIAKLHRKLIESRKKVLF
jgi:radical SAM protein with 4Fe4S-binding SPASM domain